MTTLTLQNQFVSLENFGHSLRAPAYLLKPICEEEIMEAFRLAQKTGLTVTARGAGRSYNDASLNGGGIVLDMSAMNHIINWDPETGQVTAEPGVTLQQLWQQTEPEGWWPPVVSGTMFTTLGGCLAANIHGKNNFKVGPIGEHVIEFSRASADRRTRDMFAQEKWRLVPRDDQRAGDVGDFHVHHASNEAHSFRFVGGIGAPIAQFARAPERPAR